MLINFTYGPVMRPTSGWGGELPVPLFPCVPFTENLLSYFPCYLILSFLLFPHCRKCVFLFSLFINIVLVSFFPSKLGPLFLCTPDMNALLFPCSHKIYWLIPLFPHCQNLFFLFSLFPNIVFSSAPPPPPPPPPRTRGA